MVPCMIMSREITCESWQRAFGGHAWAWDEDFIMADGVVSQCCFGDHRCCKIHAGGVLIGAVA